MLNPVRNCYSMMCSICTSQRHYSPLNVGSRFSSSARIPSFWSAVSPVRDCMCASSSNAARGSKGTFWVRLILDHRTASGAFPAIVLAISCSRRCEQSPVSRAQ